MESAKDGDDSEDANSQGINTARPKSFRSPTFHSLTSEEIAIWVDQKAKITFPILFIAFNLLYWIFASRLDCSMFKNCESDSYESF